MKAKKKAKKNPVRKSKKSATPEPRFSRVRVSCYSAQGRCVGFQFLVFQRHELDGDGGPFMYMVEALPDLEEVYGR